MFVVFGAGLLFVSLLALTGAPALAQSDVKRLVAYSSVNHMGFVAMGLAVTALVYGRMVMDGLDDPTMMGHAVIAANGGQAAG